MIMISRTSLVPLSDPASMAASDGNKRSYSQFRRGRPRLTPHADCLPHFLRRCHALCVSCDRHQRQLQKSSIRNLVQLLDVPGIAAHVRAIAYLNTGIDREGRSLQLVRADALHELASSLSRVHKLPRLETVQLTFYPGYDPHLDHGDWGPVAVQASIFGALAASFNVRAQPNLTPLSLNSLRVW
ncbi:hypothetical protein H4582DRAFT_681357 [Lactarius indigo]|nr:hypothetical protein H4582DRAFT_681357 [Lactarius indigo]